MWLTALNFLKGSWSFISNPKNLKMVLIIIAVVFAAWKISGYISDYIITKQNLVVAEQTVKDLEEQVKVIKDNEDVVDNVSKRYKPIKENNRKKHSDIEKSINEQIQKGHVNFIGPDLTAIIDRL